MSSNLKETKDKNPDEQVSESENAGSNDKTDEAISDAEKGSNNKISEAIDVNIANETLEESTNNISKGEQSIENDEPDDASTPWDENDVQELKNETKEVDTDRISEEELINKISTDDVQTPGNENDTLQIGNEELNTNEYSEDEQIMKVSSEDVEKYEGEIGYQKLQSETEEKSKRTSSEGEQSINVSVDDHQTSGQKVDMAKLQFDHKYLSDHLKSLREEMSDFQKDIKVGGKHPVTGRVMQQKVAKYFVDSGKSKMTMAYKYKMQAESNIVERNKILQQIKEQKKRLSLLDVMKFKEVEFGHKKSCKELETAKDQLVKCKTRSMIVNQSLIEMKRSLEQQELIHQELQGEVGRKVNLKRIMEAEKARNDKQSEDLKATMRKARLDPRRHNLPEVSDYARVKRESDTVRREIEKWKKKVDLAEQMKRLHLSKLKKKAT